jgi:hypothetical protein
VSADHSSKFAEAGKHIRRARSLRLSLAMLKSPSPELADPPAADPPTEGPMCSG